MAILGNIAWQKDMIMQGYLRNVIDINGLQQVRAINEYNIQENTTENEKKYLKLMKSVPGNQAGHKTIFMQSQDENKNVSIAFNKLGKSRNKQTGKQKTEQN